MVMKYHNETLGLNNREMKETFKYFAPNTFKAISLQQADMFHLCVLIQNHHVNQDDPFCWSTYNTETGKYTLHLTFDKAVSVFLKQAEGLLIQDTQEDTQPEFNYELPY